MYDGKVIFSKINASMWPQPKPLLNRAKNFFKDLEEEKDVEWYATSKIKRQKKPKKQRYCIDDIDFLSEPNRLKRPNSASNFY